jgi:uncharacterized protein YoxC
MKKKIIAIVLIVVIVIAVVLLLVKFSLDSLKLQSSQLEGDIMSLEREVEDLEAQKEELTLKNDSLKKDKSTLEDKKTKIDSTIKEYKDEKKSLEDAMPRKDLSTSVENYNLNLALVIIETKKDDKDTYLAPLKKAPIKDKNDRGDEVYTYYLKGDSASSGYVKIAYVLNRYNDAIMEIKLEYAGGDLKSDYDTYKSLVATTFAMISNESYNFDDKCVEEGEKLIKDKKYLDGKIVTVEDNVSFAIMPAES